MLLQERCLLVVHPDADRQSEIAQSIRSLGRRVLTAPDISSAFVASAENRIGVVVVAGDCDEYGAAEIGRLRRGTVGRIPIVVIVEKGSFGTSEDSSACTESDELVWPRDRELLPGTVRTYLRIVERSAASSEPESFVDELRRTGGEARKREVFDALQETSGNISKAADLLGLSRGGLQHRMRKFGIASGSR